MLALLCCFKGKRPMSVKQALKIAPKRMTVFNKSSSLTRGTTHFAMLVLCASAHVSSATVAIVATFTMEDIEMPNTIFRKVLFCTTCWLQFLFRTVQVLYMCINAALLTLLKTPKSSYLRYMVQTYYRYSIRKTTAI